MGLVLFLCIHEIYAKILRLVLFVPRAEKDICVCSRVEQKKQRRMYVV